MQCPTRPLPYGPRRPLMKINKNLHYSYQNRIFTPSVDKVHAVRPVDNNNDMPFPSQKFNSPNVRVGGRKNEKRNAGKNASTCDSSEMTSFDFFSKRIQYKQSYYPPVFV